MFTDTLWKDVNLNVHDLITEREREREGEWERERERGRERGRLFLD